MYKQAIIARNDLKLPKGKLAVQVAHASVECTLNSKKELVELWKKEGMKKTLLKTEDKDSLMALFKKAKNQGYNANLIKDAGKTAVEPGTITCIGIGPHKEQEIDKITSDLKLI